MKSVAAILGILVSFSGLQSACAVNLVANPGFETNETTYGGDSLPTTFANWHGDVTEIVGSQAGITPIGSQMLHFQDSLKSGADAINLASSQWQLIDLSAYSVEIAAGTATIEFSAKFNRVSGDSETDTQFYIEVAAYQGSPASYPSQAGSGELAILQADVFTDGDVNTWETAMGSLLLPTNTDFIAVEIAAVEDIVNDSTSPEFDGHYGDDVMVSFAAVPEPSALPLFALGLFSLTYFWCLRPRKLLVACRTPRA